jgi:uncharacterized protein YjbI with pentapeptide repeats
LVKSRALCVVLALLLAGLSAPAQETVASIAKLDCSREAMYARRVAAGVVLFEGSAHRKQSHEHRAWTWVDAGGHKKTRAELDEILAKIADLNSEHENPGVTADLRKSILAGADLRNENLSYADLSDANLEGSNLNGSLLTNTKLIRAHLTNANLSHAYVVAADLTDADLDGADVDGTNFNGSTLTCVDLRNVDVAHANLTGAILWGVNLEDTKRPMLYRGDLTKARLKGADLTGVDLSHAVFDGADLRNAKLYGADMSQARVERAIFEPSSLPQVRGIASASRLEHLSYFTNPDALAQLAKQFQDGGFRTQERQIVYAIKRRQAELLSYSCLGWKQDEPYEELKKWYDSAISDCIAYGFNVVFFDLSCQYGMTPGRPLVLVVALWLFSAILYCIFMNHNGRSGIYVVGFRLGGGGTNRQGLQLRLRPIARRTLKAHRSKYNLLFPFRWLWQEWRVVRIALYFSLMAAFNIGFREIDFGKWLRMLSKREYDLKAVGWVRTISGLQSLFSVYLIALWVLTYFGRPFQ